MYKKYFFLATFFFLSASTSFANGTTDLNELELIKMEAHLHYDPLWSMVVVFGVNLALPLALALILFLVGGRREGNDRKSYLGLASLFIIVCAVMQLLSFGYHARLALGTLEQGLVVHEEEVASSRQPHCELTLETPHGDLEADVHQVYCNKQMIGTNVPIIMVAGSTMFAQVGERATANAGLILGLGPQMLIIVLWYLIYTPVRRDPQVEGGNRND